MPAIPWDSSIQLRDTLPTQFKDMPTEEPPSWLEIGASVAKQIRSDTNFFPGVVDWAARRMGGEPDNSRIYTDEKGQHWTDPDWLKSPDLTPVQGYHPYEDPQVKGVLHGPQLLWVAHSLSPAETRQRIQQANADIANMDVIARSGWKGAVVTAAFGVTDPLSILSMMVPVAAPEAWGSRVARIAAGVAGVAATDTAAEMLLHENHPLRTWEDSAFNIGIDSVLTAGLGALVTKAPKDVWRQVINDVNDEVSKLPEFHGSGGAARVRDFINADDLRIATKAGRFLSKYAGEKILRSPIARVMNSDSKEAKLLMMEMDRVIPVLEGNVNKTFANPEPVAVRIQRRDTLSKWYAYGAYDSAYTDYVKRVGKGELSRRQFGQELAKALRRGDQSDIPEVAEAAKRVRQIFDEDKRILTEELGVLPEDVETIGAASYFPRVYDHVAIRNNLGDFFDRIHGWYRDNPKLPQETPAIKAARKAVEKEGDFAKPNEMASVVAHGEAKAARDEAVKAVSKGHEARIDAKSTLRKAEAKVAAIENDLAGLHQQRERVSETTAGDTPASAAKAAERIDAQIERIEKRLEKAEGDRKIAEDKLKEIETEQPKLKAAAKEARVAAKEAEKAAKEAKENARIVREHEKAVETAKEEHKNPILLKKRAQDTVDTILGTFTHRADIGRIGAARPMKSRTLDVPDTVLEPYLVSDFDQVMHGYFRSMIPEIETRRSGLSPEDFEARIQDIKNEYQVKMDAASSEQVRKELEKQYNRVTADLRGMRERLMNRVGSTGNSSLGWVRAARLARSYNYMRLLGSQTLSSLSDYGRIATKYGMTKTFGATVKMITNSGLRKMAKADLQRIGGAADALADTRVGTWADIADEVTGGRGWVNGLERRTAWATHQFTRVTLMSGWNTGVKTLTAMLESDAIIRAATGKLKLSKYKAGLIQSAGFDEDMLRRVADQVAKHGEEVDGLTRPRTDLWDDKEAATMLESAAVSAGNQMAIIKGIGDLPFIMDGETAKTILQFKSFGMAAVNRVMIPLAQGLSYGDAASAVGLAYMTALGALTYVSKELAAGREPNLEEKGKFLMESLNWSGAFAYAPDIWDPTAALLPGPLRSMRFSRYTDRSRPETFLGPTVGTLMNAFSTVSDLTAPTSEDDMVPTMTQAKVHQLRKMILGQNWFAVNRIFNALEGEFSEAIGTPDSTNQTFTERWAETKPTKH